MNEKPKLKRKRTLSKKELAELLEISMTTLSRWLNHKYFTQLEKFGYTKNQKVLTTKQVDFLCEQLDV